MPYKIEVSDTSGQSCILSEHFATREQAESYVATLMHYRMLNGLQTRVIKSKAARKQPPYKHPYILLNLSVWFLVVIFVIFYVGCLIAYPGPMLFSTILALGWYFGNKDRL